MKIFFIKAEKFKYFCTGCPKSALRGGQTKFLELIFSYVHLQQKVGKGLIQKM